MSKDVEYKLAEVELKLALLEAEYKEFTYIVSHDLRAPLRQIQGFTDILSAKYADVFDDKARKHMNMITAGVNQSQLIIDSLLTYSRIQSKKVEFSTVHVNDILSKTQKALFELMAELSITLNVDVNALPTIQGDNALLEQVFFHIIHNAILYQLADSKPSITICCEELENVWQFCVRDNGIGIPEKHYEKVFKPLRRNVSDKQYLGNGMGLAISKHIVKKHKGEIWLKANSDVGMSVYFTISKGL